MKKGERKMKWDGKTCPTCKKRILHLYNPKTQRGDGGECDCTKLN